MSEEIFFKALVTDRSRWIQGNYIEEITRAPGNWVTYYIKPRSADVRAYEIIPETLCIFTGKRDKCGISIMSYDLVEFIEAGERCVCQILFIDGRWTAGRDIDGEDMILLNGFDCLEDGKVIGNMHDGKRVN